VRSGRRCLFEPVFVYYSDVIRPQDTADQPCDTLSVRCASSTATGSPAR
jgi:hypothetical protein